LDGMKTNLECSWDRLPFTLLLWSVKCTQSESQAVILACLWKHVHSLVGSGLLSVCIIDFDWKLQEDL